MKVATAAEMRELDHRTIEEFGIPGVVLMENAGRGVVSEIADAWGPVWGRRFCIFCGKGNNGGDGLVIARHLHNMGARVSVRLFSEEMTYDAAVNLNAARACGVEITAVTHDMKAESSDVAHSDVVVDAIFGTGLAKEVGGSYREVINLINARARRVVAVDIPSGVDSDFGRIMGVAVRADMTVTFCLPKKGLYFYPGAQLAGDVRVVDISIPAAAVESARIPLSLITPESVRGLLPVRRPDANKGTFGHLLIIAGSAGKTGAGVLAARSASRSGAGLVTVAVPSSLNDIFEEKLTEEMTAPVAQTPRRTFSVAALDAVLQQLAGKAALVIGPGISTDHETMEFVNELLPRVEIPVIIDADGLNIIAIDDEVMSKVKAPVIMTPHPGEMGRLLGVQTVEVQADRESAALELARRYGVTAVLKGARTIVATPDGEVRINITGNAGMATGGTGDVLSGVIGALMAQGLGMTEAARLGVYMHGLAGDIAADEKGQAGLVAGDVVDALPSGFKLLQSSGGQ